MRFRPFHVMTLLSVLPALVVLAVLTGGMSGSSLPLPELPMLGDAATPKQILSEREATRYQDLFAAQERGDVEAAKAISKGVRNPLLMGHALAERYLHTRYRATFAELHSWLKAYSDLPQAEEIYRLALARRTTGDAALTPPSERRRLTGYGDSFLAANRTGNPAWQAGLNAWKNHDFAGAYRTFSALATPGPEDKRSDSDASAAAFWAYRAAKATGESNAATYWLNMASGYSNTFYGILARKARGQSIQMHTEALPEPSRDLLHQPAAQRAMALAQAGQTKLAERELRLMFPRAGKETRLQLLALARELNLPAVQISMARSLSNPVAAQVQQALYPVPAWQPEGGYALDRALLLAFARQESGFNATAKSPAGALGLMQLMPETARAMTRRAGRENAEVMNPAQNLQLGQAYLSHLLEMPAVSGNLVYLSVAYNAGPARLIQWKRELSVEDPLLFVEEIPFTETRNYVQQVLANYWVYQTMHGARAVSAGSMAQGQWPSYRTDGVFAEAK